MWGNMIIKSITGKKIYTSVQRTMRGALEEGVAKGVDFSFADLRQAKLYSASIDGIVAVGATFWGADLGGADIGLADLRKADMRCANLKDTCLAESDLGGANLCGAYFSGTIIEGAMLDKVRVSCPSFWELDIGVVRSIQNAVFSHRGEQDILIDPACWFLRGGDTPIVLNGGSCFWRGRLYRSCLPPALKKAIGSLREALDKFEAAQYSQTAIESIPKRVDPVKPI